MKVDESCNLELEAHTELDVAHLTQIARDVGDLARSRAVDAGTGVSKLRMVEDVEEFGAELSVHTLADIESFCNRQIRVEVSRAIERVAAPERVRWRTREATSGSPVRGEGGDWNEELSEGRTSTRVQSGHVSARAARFTCPARSCVDI